MYTLLVNLYLYIQHKKHVLVESCTRRSQLAVQLFFRYTMFTKICNFVKRLVIFSLKVVYGCSYVLSILKEVLRHGPRAVLTVTPREERPVVLDNEDLGKHGYARMKVGERS